MEHDGDGGGYEYFLWRLREMTVRVCHVGCGVDVMNMAVGNMRNFHADAANFLVLVAERDVVRRTVQIRGL